MNLLEIIKIKDEKQRQFRKEQYNIRKTDEVRQKKSAQKSRNFIYQNFELFIG